MRRTEYYLSDGCPDRILGAWSILIRNSNQRINKIRCAIDQTTKNTITTSY